MVLTVSGNIKINRHFKRAIENRSTFLSSNKNRSTWYFFAIKMVQYFYRAIKNRWTFFSSDKNYSTFLSSDKKIVTTFLAIKMVRHRFFVTIKISNDFSSLDINVERYLSLDFFYRTIKSRSFLSSDKNRLTFESSNKKSFDIFTDR